MRAVDPRPQDFCFQNRGRQRRTLKLLDRVQQRVGALPPLHNPLPRRRQPAENGLIDRLDFLTQFCERPPAQHPQHAGVGPFTMCPAGAELAFDKAPSGSQSK